MVAFLNQQVREALKSPEIAARMKAMGADVGGGSPADFSEVLRRDIAAWTQVIRDAGIKN